MGQKRFTSAQIIAKLREAEVEVSRGQSVPQACRSAGLRTPSEKIGVTEQTYYRWRKAYGGLRLDQAKRFKELERENGRLKRVVANQALDIAILKEASSGNF